PAVTAGALGVSAAQALTNSNSDIEGSGVPRGAWDAFLDGRDSFSSSSHDEPSRDSLEENVLIGFLPQTAQDCVYLCSSREFALFPSHNRSADHCTHAQIPEPGVGMSDNSFQDICVLS